MNILMTLQSLDIGGAETHVVELCIELKKRGHNVAIASNGGTYIQTLMAHNIPHFQVPLHNKNPLNVIKSYRMIKDLILQNNYDIVHAHARIPAFICGLLARKKKFNFKFITSAHWVFKVTPLWRLISNWGDRTVAVSNDIKNYLMDNYNTPARQIDVTINGIDTVRFNPKTDYEMTARQFALKPKNIKIVYVSRMDSDRSMVAFQLIDAVSSLKKPNIQLLIVGGGDDLLKLQAYAHKANLQSGRDDFIVVAGARTDIDKCVSCGDIFVGVSRAALEAMSAGKPTIVAGNEGYIGIISDETLPISIQTNFCCRGCAASTVEKLTEDLQKLIALSPEERKKMGELNRKIILDKYSAKAMTDDYERAYAKLYQPKMLISGYYGHKNAGDDSILNAMLKTLDDNGLGGNLCVLSHTPYDTQKAYGVMAINRFNPCKIIAKMKSYNGLISGGGSILQDVTSTKSLLYYLKIIQMAKHYGMKVFVYANGIGPIYNPKNIKKTLQTLEHVDKITLREENSLNELRVMGMDTKNVVVTADPVFVTDMPTDDEIAEIIKDCGMKYASLPDKKLPSKGASDERQAAEGLADKSLTDKSKNNLNKNVKTIAKNDDNDKNFFLISVRDWKDNCPHFETVLADVIDHIANKNNLVPVFATMQPQKDRIITKKIMSRLACKSILLPPEYSVKEILAVMSKCRLV
ncbi:MAG: polysaccharide pyruvyl transferase family protein, partial [Clostridiales bacterium]|nr:polysaccharide pyruvyl transferase family protein [Clostridiales bacterium]